jgi:isoleucyl-tRNA synthetase
VIKQFGAEVLRLWVAAEDYRDDIRISSEIIQRLSEAYRRFRNTCRFLLGNLDGFDPDTQKLPCQDLEEIDRWVLHRLAVLVEKVREAYESFEFHKVYHTIHNFCVVDLSAFYLDVLKDRLYCDRIDSRERRSAQTALYEILTTLTRLYAPVLPFTTEEIWGFLPPTQAGKERSVHLSRFPEPNTAYLDEQLGQRWEELLTIRGEVNQALEEARRQKKIGSSLEAHVVVSAKGRQFDVLQEYGPFLPTLFIASRVSVHPSPDEEGQPLTVVIEGASGAKCERCWNYRPSVGENPDHPTICERCRNALALS